jgi:hypothetical protein
VVRDLDRATRTIVRYKRARPGELLHVDLKKQERIPDRSPWKALRPEVERRSKRAYQNRPPDGSRRRTRGYGYLYIALDGCSMIA